MYKSLLCARNSSCRRTPALLLSRERPLISWPLAASSLEMSRSAAARAFRDVIHRANGAGEHRRPNLAHAQGDELVDLSGLRSHRGGKAQGVLPNDPAGGQQDVVEVMPVGAADNLATMFKAGAQPA